MSQIDITALNTALGAYWRTNKKELIKRLYQKTESEMFMRSVPGIQDEYVGVRASIGEVLQAFQCAWTPKGDVTLDPIINKVRPYKVEVELECLEELQRSHAGYLVDEGKTVDEQPITAYIFELLFEKIIEEKELNAATASWLAPTPGTPGDAANAFDGFLTTLAGLITASAVTPIPTGALSAAGLFDTIEDWVATIPPLYRKRGGDLLMSDTRAMQLYRDHRTSFVNTYVPGQPFEVKFANTSIVARGLVSMEGSDRILFTPRSNFLRMFDVHDAPSMGQINTQVDKRKLCIWWDAKIGYGFERAEEVFCNDQA